MYLSEDCRSAFHSEVSLNRFDPTCPEPVADYVNNHSRPVKLFKRFASPDAVFLQPCPYLRTTFIRVSYRSPWISGYLHKRSLSTNVLPIPRQTPTGTIEILHSLCINDDLQTFQETIKLLLASAKPGGFAIEELGEVMIEAIKHHILARWQRYPFERHNASGWTYFDAILAYEPRDPFAYSSRARENGCNSSFGQPRSRH